MRKFFRGLYWKISAIFLVLLSILVVVQILVSVHSALNFVKESDQKLNRGLARALAEKFSPFLKDSLDYAAIEHAIHELTVMNPRVEIYLLSNEGTILAYFAAPDKIRRKVVNIEPVERFLREKDRLHKPIYGDDPRSADRQKMFSAAPIVIGSQQPGYLYVILGGEQHDSALDAVKGSSILRITASSLIITFIFTGVVGLILFFLLTRRLRAMTAAVREFEKNNFQQRIPVKSNDEIGQLGKAFNQMADTIVANMEEMKKNDGLRRELIANVSHDLRSPLTSIQGYLETILMKESSLSAERRQRYLETILNNATMLSELVAELFELSKLDAKQTTPKPEPFSVAELTQDVVLKFQPQARLFQFPQQGESPLRV